MKMEEPEDSKPSDRYLNGLIQKAEINREIYSKKYRFYRIISSFLFFVVVLFGTAIATISIASNDLLSIFFSPDSIILIKNSVAISGFFIFILSIADRIWNLQGNMSLYEMGIKSTTEFIRICQRIRKVDMPSITDEEIKAKLEYVQSQYTMQQYLLPINDDDILFIKAKKRYLLKRKISESLDIDPDVDIKPVIKDLNKL